MPEQIVSVTNGNALYIDGLQCNVWDSSVGLWGVSSGHCRDSNNLVDISLNLGLDEIQTITNSFVGPGGVDISNSLNLVSTVYAIYVIADSYGNHQTNTLCSVSTYGYVPILPAGYDSYRLVGYVKSSTEGIFDDNTANVGIHNDRQTIYLNYQQAVGEPSATLVEAPLSNLVPYIDNLNVTIGVNYTGAVQTNSLQVASVNDPSEAYIFLQTQVATTVLSNQYDVACPVNQSTNIPSFFYITGSTDTVSIFVEKFYYTA